MKTKIFIALLCTGLFLMIVNAAKAARLGDACGVSANYANCDTGLSCVNSGQTSSDGSPYFYCADSPSASTGAPNSGISTGTPPSTNPGTGTPPTSNPGTGTPPSTSNLSGNGIEIPTNTGLPGPQGGIKAILENLLRWLLGIVGIIALIGFVISGLQYILASGSEDTVETAKRNMTYSIIGMVVALAGFVIIQAIDFALRAKSF